MLCAMVRAAVRVRPWRAALECRVTRSGVTGFGALVVCLDEEA